MGITLQDIDNAENAVKNVRVALDAIGREIYLMREGEKLGAEYGFDRYSREQFCGTNYLGQEGPDWGVGTPILSLTFYWSRAGDVIHVTFPQAYLEMDWRALEQARLDKERDENFERERAAKERAARDREASELATYERLKAKFEAGRAALADGGRDEQR